MPIGTYRPEVEKAPVDWTKDERCLGDYIQFANGGRDESPAAEVGRWKFKNVLRNTILMLFWICVALALVGAGMVIIIKLAEWGVRL